METGIYRVDGFKNIIAGIGGPLDKRTRTEPGVFIKHVDTELVNAYLGDGFSRNLVDIPANDMTREWITIENDPEEIILNKLADLRAEVQLNLALKWARLYGGSFVIMGVMDGRMLNQPLSNNLTGKEIEWLYVGDKTMIDRPGSIVDNDPKSKTYGQIKQYRIRIVHGAGMDDGAYEMVDASRVLVFKGEPAPRSGSTIDQDMAYWGMSVLEAAWQTLIDFGGTVSSVASIMYELIIGVFRLKELDQKLALGEDGVNQVITRMNIINTSKSVINSVLLDTEESFDRNTANVGGIAELIDRFMMFISSVAKIPVSRFFGRSAAGLNSTGQEELDNYYDSIRSAQKNSLQPPLQRLVDIIAASKSVPGEDHMIVFNSLEQASPSEEAEINSKRASTFQTYMSGLQIAMENGFIDGPQGEQIVKAIAFEQFEEISKVLGAPESKVIEGVATYEAGD